MITDNDNSSVPEIKPSDRPLWICRRCGHEWESRAGMKGEPQSCPKCKSYFWREKAGGK